MREGFDILRWVKEVKAKKPEMDALVASLRKYGASVEPDKDSNDIASLHYRVVFSFLEQEAIVTIGIILLDHQTNSDVVIETMTTLPNNKIRKGFGSKAIANILQWAADNGFKDVCATQVAGEDNENFWRKNGFLRQENPKPCNDFVFRFPRESA
jgi:hypothetical protein